METTTTIAVSKAEARRQAYAALTKGAKEHLVFTYGTLLSGEPNNQLLQDSKLIGPATTEPKFRMFSNGWFPYVQYELGYHLDVKAYAIHGELWQVDDATLARLDKLEGVPHHYRRETTNVTLDSASSVASDQSVRPTFIYLFYGSTSQLEEIESGNWKQHRQEIKQRIF